SFIISAKCRTSVCGGRISDQRWLLVAPMAASTNFSKYSPAQPPSAARGFAAVLACSLFPGRRLRDSVARGQTSGTLRYGTRRLEARTGSLEAYLWLR